MRYIIGMTPSSNITMGTGFSQTKDTSKAAKEALVEAKTKINTDKIDLVIIFSSIEYAYYTTVNTIAAYLGTVPIVGCSTAAIIYNEAIFRKGVLIILLSISKEVYFNTGFIKDIRLKGALNAGEELGEKLSFGFHGIRRDLAIIFSDGLIQDSSNFISGLQEKLGTSFPLIGASASDNLQFKKTFVYSNQQVLDNAACAIIWGGRLNFVWGIHHGWKPLGKPRYATKAKANVLYEIDNQPAARIYEEYLARGPADLKKELRRISIFYPIGIYVPGEKEYLLRNLHSIQNDGSLVLQGNVPENSLIRLMIGTKESCLNATYQALEEIQKGFFGKKIGFVFVFNSISRYILLGRLANQELKIIREKIGRDIPIIGIYTYGEQAPLRAINYQGKTHFHNQTITILGVEG